MVLYTVVNGPHYYKGNNQKDSEMTKQELKNTLKYETGIIKLDNLGNQWCSLCGRHADDDKSEIRHSDECPFVDALDVLLTASEESSNFLLEVEKYNNLDIFKDCVLNIDEGSLGILEDHIDRLYKAQDQDTRSNILRCMQAMVHLDDLVVESVEHRGILTKSQYNTFRNYVLYEYSTQQASARIVQELQDLTQIRARLSKQLNALMSMAYGIKVNLN